MKKIIYILTMIGLLSSCKPQISTQQQSNFNCPQNSDYTPTLKITSPEEIYQLFNLYIRDIVSNKDTITFKTINHDLIFCRGNETWTIQPGTFTQEDNREKSYEEIMQELANPQYQTISLNSKKYQYRVRLDPNPFSDFTVEANQVIFELITPQNQQPQSQIVYTLEQTKQAQAGIQLGLPQISATLIHDNRIFWAISPEQGEGNGGIASIISYDPQTEKIEIIQPQEIQTQQINDLVISGEGNNLTFWLATQISGEGNPYLPSMGLVAYRPQESNSVKSYHVRNSNIVGAIPTKLKLEENLLWVGTGNGICRLEWAKIDNPKTWSCWQFILEAKLPDDGVLIYPNLFSEKSLDTLTSEKVEVLWWSPVGQKGDRGRYEVRYEPGITVKLDEQGATSWAEVYGDLSLTRNWQAPVYWVGQDWYWRGDKFMRGFDSVPLNAVGGGPMGIISWENTDNYRPDLYAIRGDLDLLNLSKNSTTIKHYSAWANANLLTPYLTVIPQPELEENKPNPLVITSTD